MVNVGDSVKDTITGLAGIAVCRAVWLYGCVRVGVQPRTAKEGKVPDIVYIDEPQLRLVKRAVMSPAGDMPKPFLSGRSGPRGKEEQSAGGSPSDEYFPEDDKRAYY